MAEEIDNPLIPKDIKLSCSCTCQGRKSWLSARICIRPLFSETVKVEAFWFPTAEHYLLPHGHRHHFSPLGTNSSQHFVGMCRSMTVCAHVHTHMPATSYLRNLMWENCLQSYCKDVSLESHLVRAHLAASCSLARTQIATWQPQLVENEAAGLLGGAGCPLCLRNTWLSPLAANLAWENPECLRSRLTI